MQNGCRSFLIQSATGSGKTLLTAYMLKTAASKGFNSFFCVHRRELIKQSMRTFTAVGLKYGVCAAKFEEERNYPVQIASIQTLARRYKRFKKPRLIIWDECHHLAAKSWATVYSAFPDAFHIGLSATPERTDGKGLGNWFSKIILGPSMSSLIDEGYLSKYKIYAPANVNLSNVHTQMGDYNKAELGAVMDKPTITGEAVQHYLKYAPGKRALVRGVSVEHSKHIALKFQEAGIPARHVDGETETEERDNAMRLFTEGKILVLSFVDLFSEGVDVPGIEAVIDLRPTQSLTLWLQFLGRALRPAPGKEMAIICDAVGNTARHGLPDEPREWSLLDRNKAKKNSDESDVSIKICPKCFAAMKFGPLACKFCGFVFEIKQREIKQVEGDLVEIDPVVARRNRNIEQGRAETVADLAEIGKKRGYKSPWAWAKYIFNARQAKKLSTGRAA